MDDELRSLEEVPFDVFEAIKRARIRGGFFRIGTRIGGQKAAAKRQNTAKPAPQTEAAKEPQPNPDGAVADSTDEDPERLLDITTNAHDVLFEASTVFPFTLFPSTVTIDREKVTIANRYFFRVATINSTPITDIQSVEADVGPFFGTVKTTSKYFMNNPREVNFLRRKDAIEMQRLLQGYIIAHKRKVDCNGVDKEQLIILLNDLGQGATD